MGIGYTNYKRITVISEKELLIRMQLPRMAPFSIMVQLIIIAPIVYFVVINLNENRAINILINLLIASGGQTTNWNQFVAIIALLALVYFWVSTNGTTSSHEMYFQHF